MARSKRSAALFEVIHSARRPGLLRTPKWWFKSDNAPQPAEPQAQPEAPVEEPAVAAPVIPTSMYGSRALAASRTSLRLDRDRNEVTMRMRLGTAVVGTFAVLVALGLAYVVGQRVANGPKLADGSELSTDEIRQQAPLPNALDVSRRTSKPATANRSTIPGTPAGRHNEVAVRPKPLVPPTGTDADSQPKPAAAGPRNPDRNYILIQVVEARNRKVAEKTCDALNQAGVPCSIEKVPVGFGNNTEEVAIITQQGFTGPSDPEGRACEQRITQVATKSKLSVAIAYFKGTKLR